MKYENVTLIGTSHIASKSMQEVTKHIEEKQPDIVAVELDKQRLQGLFKKKDDKIRLYDIKRVGVKGFLFSLLGAWASQKLGKLVGVTPGSEMKTAVKLARKHKLKIALIDQDIEITLKKISKNLTWKEKGRFLVDVVKATFSKDEGEEFDLTSVPDQKTIKKLIGQVKKRYPTIYRVLIEERNEVMAQNLKKIMAQHPEKKIVAIIGAGHEQEILDMIKKPSITYSVTVGR